MRFLAVSATTFIALASAQEVTDPTVGTPPNVVCGQPTSIPWTATNAPVIITVQDAAQPFGTALETIAQGTSDSPLTWSVDVTPGSQIQFSIRDAKGVVNFSSPITVQGAAGCGTISASGGGAPGAGSSAAPSTDAGAVSSVASAASSAEASASSVLDSATSAASAAVSSVTAGASSALSQVSRSVSAQASSVSSASSPSASNADNAANGVIPSLSAGLFALLAYFL